MRIVVMTVVAVAWLTMPAQAQSRQSQLRPPVTVSPAWTSSDPEEHHTVKADEKAYKSALTGSAQESFDPWGNVREKPKASNSR